MPCRAEAAPPGPPGDTIQPEAAELSSDLMVTASKRLQRTQAVPAIVRVFSRDEIVRGGFRDVNELLGAIPEIEVVDTGRYQYLLIKGAPFTVLVLLDGTSLVNHFDNTVDLERLVPIEIVQRVEVVLSPGGVLWGAHSVFGVVNIITTQPRAERQQRLVVSGGWWQTLRGAYTLTSGWSDLRWKLHASVESYRSETVHVDDSVFAPPFRFGNRGDTENDVGLAVSTFGALDWRGWYLRALAQLVDEHPFAIDEQTGARARRGENGMIELPTASVDLGHRRTLRLGEGALGLSGRAYLYHQRYEDTSHQYPDSDQLPGGAVAIGRVDHQLRVGATAEAQLRWGWSHTIVGADFFRTSASKEESDLSMGGRQSRIEMVPATAAYTGSVYGQQEIFLLRDINAAVGVRLNLSDSYRAAVLLHGHAVYEPIDGLWIKANYSEGLRPPSFEQRFTDAPFQKGDQSLSPERSRVVELQASYLLALASGLRFELTGGYTYARFSDLIAPVEQDGEFYFRNLASSQIHSISVIGRARLPRAFCAGVHLAAHFPAGGEDEDGDRRDFARLRVAVDAELLRLDPVTLALRYAFTGSRQVRDYFSPQTRRPVDLDVDGYHQLTLSIRWRIFRSELFLTVQGRNLLFDDHDHIPPYTHDDVTYRGLFPQPAAAYGFASLEWIHDL